MNITQMLYIFLKAPPFINAFLRYLWLIYQIVFLIHVIWWHYGLLGKQKKQHKNKSHEQRDQIKTSTNKMYYPFNVYELCS